MFFQTSFNEDIGTNVVTVNGVTYTAWDTLNVTNMGLMFYKKYCIYNSSINNWNTSKVTTIDNIFLVLSLINHYWNVSLN
jgi:hypothetical protein